jgi:MFS family permease
MESEKKLMSTLNNSKVQIEANENVLRKEVAILQIFIAFLANLSILAPGMGMGYPAVTSEILLRDKTMVLSTNQVSWFASITPFTCPFGGVLSSLFVTKFGRRGTLIFINVISIIHWLIIAFSHQSNVHVLFIQLLIARVLTGLAIGMCTAPAVLYSTEICHPKLRGKLAILSAPLFLSLGIGLIYFFGYITGVS